MRQEDYEMRVTKKQHYVPQFYLRGFSEASGTLAVLDKGSGAGKLYRANVRDVCEKNYLYETPSNDPDWPAGRFVSPNYKEEMLSKEEKQFAEALKDAIDVCKQGVPSPVDTRERVAELSHFIASLIVRNPEVFPSFVSDVISSCENSLQDCEQDAKEHGFGKVYPGLVEDIAVFHMLFGKNEGSSRAAIVNDLMKMEYRFVVAPEDAAFATSSLPASPFVQEIGGLCRLEDLYFPLSSESAIVFVRHPRVRLPSVVKADKRIVDKLNARFFDANTVRRVMARDEQALVDACVHARSEWPPLSAARSMR